MPKIPTVPGRGGESTSTGILPPGTSAAAFGKIAADLNRFAVITGRIAEEDQRQRDSITMSRSMLAAEESLSSLYAAAVESEDYEQAGAVFEKSAQAAFGAIVAGITNEEDQFKFAVTYNSNASGKRLQMS